MNTYLWIFLAVLVVFLIALRMILKSDSSISVEMKILLGSLKITKQNSDKKESCTVILDDIPAADNNK
jgi:hypothetical protein